MYSMDFADFEMTGLVRVYEGNIQFMGQGSITSMVKNLCSFQYVCYCDEYEPPYLETDSGRISLPQTVYEFKTHTFPTPYSGKFTFGHPTGEYSGSGGEITNFQCLDK